MYILMCERKISRFPSFNFQVALKTTNFTMEGKPLPHLFVARLKRQCRIPSYCSLCLQILRNRYCK